MKKPDCILGDVLVTPKLTLAGGNLSAGFPETLSVSVNEHDDAFRITVRYLGFAGFAVVTERSRIREAVSFITVEIAVLSAAITAELWDGAE